MIVQLFWEAWAGTLKEVDHPCTEDRQCVSKPFECYPT